MIARLLMCAVAVTALWSTNVNAQDKPTPPPITQGAGNIKRIPLQKFDVPGTPYETIIGIAEVVPNVLIGRHTHFGVEAGYVLEGEATLMVSGQPDKLIKAGDSYQIPAGVPHDAKSGPKGAKIIASYVVEKGKPLATPAP